MRQILSLLSLVLIFSFFISPASAQETKIKGLEVYPAYTEVTLDKQDQQKQVEFTYINHNDTPLRIQMSALDFKSDPTGIINIFEAQGNYSYSLSSFLSLEASEFFLAPKEQKTFKVTIQNREDISPGGHYAAVVARFLEEEGSPTTASNIMPSLSSLVLLRKTGGEKFNLKLIDTDLGSNRVNFSYPDLVTLTFRNEGNIHVIPYGEVLIKDTFGRLIQRGVINLSSNIIMPESQRAIPVQMAEVTFSWPISLNQVEVKGQDSLKKITYSKSWTFLYVNPLSAIALILIIPAIFYALKIYRSKKLGKS